MPTKSGREVPPHIRDNLPVELSELPAEWMYTAIVLGFSRSESEPVRQAAEAHDSLVQFFTDLYGGAWPPEAVDAARETWVVFECAHQRMGEAMWWVRTMLVTTDSSSDEEQAKKQAKMRAKKQAKKQTKKQDEEAGRRSGRRSSSDEEALASSQGQAWDGRMEVDESGEEAGGDDTQDDPVL